MRLYYNIATVRCIVVRGVLGRLYDYGFALNAELITC
jgi:hypothetical protein